MESFTGETGAQLIPTTKEKTMTAKWLWALIGSHLYGTF